MLTRIGFGLVLTVCVVFCYFVIDVAGHLVAEEHLECYFNVCWNMWPYDTTGLPLSHHWMAIPRVLELLMYVFLTIPSLEFIVAQSPDRMRGLMVGIWYATQGLLQLTMKNSFFAFLFIVPLRDATPSCMTYYYIAKIVFLAGMFVVFLVLVRRYRMRQREVVVNIHQIAEEHYERYMEQEEEYRREMGITSSSSSSEEEEEEEEVEEEVEVEEEEEEEVVGEHQSEEN